MNARQGSLSKRSVILDGRRTSIALEPEFWAALQAMAKEQGVSLNRLLAAQARHMKPGGSVASCLRICALFAHNPELQTRLLEQDRARPSPHIGGPLFMDIFRRSSGQR